MKSPPLPLGTKTQWGTIDAVAWLGERYYFMTDKRGGVAMIPAFIVEEQDRSRCKKCGGAMNEGKAIVNMLTGISDFIGSNEVCTVSPDPHQFKLIDCLKCEKCGWSMT